jgi:hypothetical protein
VTNYPKPQLVVCLAILVAACAPAVVPPPTVVPPSTITSTGVAPDTIPCSEPLVVKASNEPNGIRAERDWLDARYPNHGSLSSHLSGDRTTRFDVFTFTTADGHEALVCFDITSFLGKW